MTTGRLDDVAVDHVGWSEHADGAGAHVIVMRERHASGYCVVVGDDVAHGTYYGGVVSAELGVSATTLVFDAAAAKALGVAGLLRLKHPTGAVDPSVLQQHLDRLLRPAE